MKKLLVILALAVFVFPNAYGRNPRQASPAGTTAPGGSVSRTFIIGEVIQIDPNSKHLMIKTDNGSTVAAILNAATSYLLVAPGETTLDKATVTNLAGISIGDRVIVRGRVAEDQKTIPAQTVIVMTQADIKEKQQRQSAEWNKRGTRGVITAINAETKEVTLESAPGRPDKKIIIQVGVNNVRFRRYAPDSIKFSDAKQSSFAELSVGDEVRALGEKSGDGKFFIAEEIISGSFSNIGGTIIAIDPAAGEIKISDIMTKSIITISVNKNSRLRRLTPDLTALLIKNMQGASGAAASTQPAQGGAPSAQGGADVQEIFDRLPVVGIEDLKPKEMILVSSTKGTAPSRITAISLISGVEPLFNALRGTRRPIPNLGTMGAN